MIYRFGVFSFDDRAMLLARGDREIALEPQPARALALLLSRAGDVVSREQLRTHLWSENTHVDFDRGLAYCIGQLRTALGDSGDNPRFVQTLPRRGFRFIAPVQRKEAAPVGASADTAAPLPPALASPADAESASPVNVSPWIAGVAIATVALVVGAAGALMVARDRPSTHITPAARPIVAVAMFENETGDPARDSAVRSVSGAIVERLAAMGPSRIGVNGHAPILRRAADVRDWRTVARETGAGYLISGQLQTKDTRLSLLMQLIRLDDGTHVWVQRITRPEGDRLDALDVDASAEVDAAVRRLVLKQ